MSPVPGHHPAVDRAVDLAVVLVAGALTASVVWFSPNPVGTGVAGPAWLVFWLPFLWAVPLWWRRSRPVLAWAVILAALTVQSVITGNSPEGLELIFVFSVAS